MGAEGVDAAAGMLVHKKVGDFVQAGEVLATLQSSRPIDESFVVEARECFVLGTKASPITLIAGVVSEG